jgi:hypothetical protein
MCLGICRWVGVCKVLLKQWVHQIFQREKEGYKILQATS